MKEAVIIGTIAREKGTDGDPSAVGAKWRVAGGGGERNRTGKGEWMVPAEEKTQALPFLPSGVWTGTWIGYFPHLLFQRRKRLPPLAGCDGREVRARPSLCSGTYRGCFQLHLARWRPFRVQDERRGRVARYQGKRVP